MEALLKSYNDMRALIKSLERELEQATKGISEDEINDAILSLALHHGAPSSIVSHTPGNTPDKTANVALTYRKKLEDERKELIDTLTGELTLLKLILDKVEIGLNSLSDTQRSVIEKRYLAGLDWFTILDELEKSGIFLSKYQAQRLRREAIERLMRVARITVGQYELAMKLINLKG